jgi:RpiB/LacA/LacB family sugar-phosphate isomerase
MSGHHRACGPVDFSKRTEDRRLKIAVASDHAGFPLKEEIKSFLSGRGHDILDLGAYDTQSTDYPDFARSLGVVVRDGRAVRGILFCGSGVGASIAANKMRGVRAGVCHDVYSAHQAVEHDDMNVLCLGSRVIGGALAADLVLAFLNAKFTQEERHRRRLDKVLAIEREECGPL